MDDFTETIQLILKEIEFDEVDYYVNNNTLVYKHNSNVVKRLTKDNIQITAMSLFNKNIKINLFINSK